ncbi:hypothetical protein BGW38_007568 [Lunasporangiospora selenospora]|uniref:THO complex subunit 1 n=1 Tax=Lunasporangiospora selenospora TaxID=979761 RepID=A0A9P6KFX8_9FUNG|nr:hypothetical protein BGW38_007568 [Lunasporangiospora selenospora]
MLLPPFAPLIDTTAIITTILAQTQNTPASSAHIATKSDAQKDNTPFKNRPNILDAPINENLLPAISKYTALDRATLLEGAFRMKLISIQDEHGSDIVNLKDAMFRCLDFVVRCSELELIDHATPINYIEEILDFQTVECSEHIYDYLESRVERLTVNMIAGRGKGLTLLRLCNELLRRLSKAKNTVFCGRILMLLSSVFPLTERSGVNLKGDFNIENITHLEGDDASIVPDLDSTKTPSGEKMDVDEALTNEKDTQDREEGSLGGDDPKFYSEFWGLQAFFSNPSSLINSPDNITKLRHGVDNTIDRFVAIEEAEKTHGQVQNAADQISDSPSDISGSTGTNADMGLSTKDGALLSTKRKVASTKESSNGSTIYYPKFLTSPKLLKLEGHSLAAKESYAKIATPNKSIQPQWVLEDADREWTEKVSPKIMKVLSTIGHESGDEDFLSTVKAILAHEENWIKWKAESCQPFEKQPLSAEEIESTRVKRQKLANSLAPLKQKLGCASLTELWRKAAENTTAYSRLGTIIPPRTVEDYIENPNFGSGRGGFGMSREEREELERSRLWRAMRLGARQYLHLYGKVTANLDYGFLSLKDDIEQDNRPPEPEEESKEGDNEEEDKEDEKEDEKEENKEDSREDEQEDKEDKKSDSEDEVMKDSETQAKAEESEDVKENASQDDQEIEKVKDDDVKMDSPETSADASGSKVDDRASDGNDQDGDKDQVLATGDNQ